MVGDVVVADVMEEEPSEPAKERAIDGGCCSPKEGPFALAVMGYSRVGVVEIGDCEFRCLLSGGADVLILCASMTYGQRAGWRRTLTNGSQAAWGG